MAQAVGTVDNTQLSSHIPNLSLLSLNHKFVHGCVKCDGFFDKDNKPYFIKCGHSICKDCKDTYIDKLFTCYKCAVILPNANDAFINKFLWQQIMRYDKDPPFVKLIEAREKEAATDPGLFIEKELTDRARQLLELKMLYQNLLDESIESTGYENLTDEYRRILADFGTEQKNGLKEALINLSGKVGKIETNLRNVNECDKILEKLNEVKSKFFKIIKNVQIQYDQKKVCDLLDQNHVIYAVTEKDNELLAAQFTHEEIGLHINRCKPEQNTGPKLFFWCDDFSNKDVDQPKYIFLDLLATVAEKRLSKRIYITILKSSYSKELLELFIGLHGSWITQGTCLKLSGNSLCGYLPDPTGLTKEGLTEYATVGVVSLVPEETKAKLVITLNVLDKEESVDNVIGHVTCGRGFLTQAEKFDIVNHGVCYEGIKTWY